MLNLSTLLAVGLGGPEVTEKWKVISDEPCLQHAVLAAVRDQNADGATDLAVVFVPVLPGRQHDGNLRVLCGLTGRSIRSGDRAVPDSERLLWIRVDEKGQVLGAWRASDQRDNGYLCSLPRSSQATLEDRVQVEGIRPDAWGWDYGDVFLSIDSETVDPESPLSGGVVVVDHCDAPDGGRVRVLKRGESVSTPVLGADLGLRVDGVRRIAPSNGALGGWLLLSRRDELLVTTDDLLRLRAVWTCPGLMSANVAGDADADGVQDIVAVRSGGGAAPDLISLYSGKTGAQLRTLTHIDVFDTLGAAMIGPIPMIQDLSLSLISGPTRFFGRSSIDAGSIYLISSRDGTPELSIDARNEDDFFGAAMAWGRGAESEDGIILFTSGVDRRTGAACARAYGMAWRE